MLAILGALAVGVVLSPRAASRAEDDADLQPAVPHVRVAAAGDQARLRILYNDSAFQLSDEGYVPDEDDLVAPGRRTVVNGGPGLATVFACCSVGDAPTTIVLLAGRPPAPAWTQSAEVDLDRPSGQLAISGTDGLLAIAELPSGAYRVRVSGRDAHEFQQRRERFLIELWRRA